MYRLRLVMDTVFERVQAPSIQISEGNSALLSTTLELFTSDADSAGMYGEVPNFGSTKADGLIT